MPNLKLGNTQAIIKECANAGLYRNQAAYVLATAYWETGRTMKPVKEAYWLSEEWRKKNLRYYPWYGRGYVQLTWETNYRRASRELGIDFVGDKSRALQAVPAAKILVTGMKEGWFTRKRLDQYITLKKSDFRNARRIVNGMDKASTIASLAKQYDKQLRNTDYAKRAEGWTPATTTPDKPKIVNPSEGFLSKLINMLTRMFQK